MGDEKKGKPAASGVWSTIKPFVNGGASGMLATCVIQPIDMIKVTSSFHLSVLFLYLFLQMDFWVCSIFVAGFRSVGFCVRFLFLCVVGFDGFGGVGEDSTWARISCAGHFHHA